MLTKKKFPILGGKRLENPPARNKPNKTRIPGILGQQENTIYGSESLPLPGIVYHGSVRAILLRTGTSEVHNPSWLGIRQATGVLPDHGPAGTEIAAEQRIWPRSGKDMRAGGRQGENPLNTLIFLMKPRGWFRWKASLSVTGASRTYFVFTYLRGYMFVPFCEKTFFPLAPRNTVLQNATTKAVQ